MSSRNFLTQPFDPSAGGNWTAGQAAELTQFLQLATPDATAGATLGWIITSASTPNVVTYPELVNFLWLKPVSASVQELYSWNGTSWQKVSAIASIADGSIALTKLQTVLGDANKVIQYSVTGVPTAVALGSLFGTDTIAYDSLEYATIGSNYILISDETTGRFQAGLWTSIFTSALYATDAPVANLADLDSVGIAGQVPAIISTGANLELRYIEDLLRANQTPTSKLIYPTGGAGKFLRVTSSGLDVEAVEAATPPKYAVLQRSRSGLAAGAFCQAFTDGSATAVVTLDTSAYYDPDSLLSGLTGSGFTLQAGTYLVDIVMPIKTNLADTLFCRVELHDGSSAAFAQNISVYAYSNVHLTGRLYLTTAASYELRVVPSGNASYDFRDSGVGMSAGLAGSEVFITVRIVKTA